MEFNLILQMLEIFEMVFSMFFSMLIELIPEIAKFCIALNKIKPINLLCIGLGVPTITITILKFLFKKAILED